VHGGENNSLELMERALAAQGIEVETATTDDDGPGRRSGKPCGIPLKEEWATRWYFAKTTERYKTSIGFARWIGANVRRYDLVHVHALFSFTSSAAGWVARRAGVPYVIEPLGTLNRYGMERRRALSKRLSLRALEGPLLRDAAAVRFTSEEEAAEASRLGWSCNDVVVPLGLDFATPAPVRRAGAGFHLLFLSRLDPKKNLEGLLDAFALLKDDAPHLRLTIAGAGPDPYVAALHAHAQRLGIENRVEWAGHLEGRAKQDAFGNADIFVLPSFSENFGIAAVEALGYGLPCLLGRGVAISADVETAGAGMRTGTQAREIALDLRRMIGRRDELATMSSSAMHLARERYSIDAMGRRLKQMYTDILDR
jgi:glycosyltransferase involved in cell wall biosynthesis